MNKSYHSSDSAGYFYTSVIAKEFDNFHVELLSKYTDMPFGIFVVLRCLHKDSNWKTKGRYYTEDNGDKCLGIDVVVYEEDFAAIRNNKVCQRLEFGKELFTFLTDKFNKLDKKVPYIKERKDEMLSDMKKWFLENYWLKEIDNEPINFDIKDWVLQKSELIFGKPVSKKVTDEIDEQIQMANALTAIKYQNLIWNIDNNRQIESWFILNENKEWRCCWFNIKE